MKHTMSTVIALTLFLVAGAWAQEEPEPSIGPQFHFQTSYGDEGFKGDDITQGKEVPLYKQYEGAIKMILPAPAPGGMSLEQALQKRQSVRSFEKKPVTLAQLSRLLLSADGITRRRGDFDFRSAPSAGALYPMEIYVVAANVESLPAGLYHFQVSDSSLELVREGDLSREAHEAAFEQDCVGSSPVTLILAARFDRVTRKYSDRGYRYAYMESGAVCQNIYLEAASLGLGTVVAGAFSDDAVNALVGVNGHEEAVLLIMPVGYPSGR
ncbi:MAG TPA: SagB/ThcOx family dehydrogenase [Acidobacteriota bacterium]|nr:SagB/ThcOx family dehydrogenase [Acidobacteriota bacterium]